MKMLCTEEVIENTVINKVDWLGKSADLLDWIQKIITPYFTPFAGVNMPKYAYIMPANENEKGAKTLIKQGKTI